MMNLALSRKGKSAVRIQNINQSSLQSLLGCRCSQNYVVFIFQLVTETSREEKTKGGKRDGERGRREEGAQRAPKRRSTNDSP